MANGDGVVDLVVKKWTTESGITKTIHHLHREIYWARYVDWSRSS